MSPLRTFCILVVWGIAGSVSDARANMPSADCDLAACPSMLAASVLETILSDPLPGDFPALPGLPMTSVFASLPDVAGFARVEDWPVAGRDSQPFSPVIEIPGLPGSAPLCLSALATLGAIKLVRTGRKVSFSGAPDWYYTGPYRANGCVLDLNTYPLPACRLATDPADKPLIMLPVRAYGERPPARLAECVLTTLDLRGPPAALRSL